MRVLLAHNFYRSGTPGGEDNAFRQERALLEDNGVEVVTFERSNDDVDRTNPVEMLRTAVTMSWSRQVYRELRSLLRESRPDIAHFHNTFPLISPSAYAACHDSGVPVVQTLHNYRFVCAAATLYRDGFTCEKCLGRSPWPGVLHRCYRGSSAGSTAVAWMLDRNRDRGTYLELIDRYIALTNFAAGKFVEGGLPRERIAVKPNFVVTDRQPGEGGGGYVVYAGRLSIEKGVMTMLEAWRQLRDVRLIVVGEGPLRGEMEREVERHALPVEFLGLQPRERVIDIIARADLEVVTSEWYEGFPLVIVEAYAVGTPVVCSRIGSLVEIVADGETGFMYEQGNAGALARVIRDALRSEDRLREMRARARQRYLTLFTPGRNFRMLTDIYRGVLEQRRRRAAQ
jgi:glycosyltransferase involved in cell wall biosynthesis